MQIREEKIYSQNGEDGVIGSIFEAIGVTDRVFVEIGCEDGTECNSRYLLEVCGWSGIRLDSAYSDPARSLYRHFVTPENACELLAQYEIPRAFDLLSVDVDFSDFHILSAILSEHKPRVVITEYNSSLGPEIDAVVPSIPGAFWDRTNYFGASYKAFTRLADFFGYSVVYCESVGVNLFMIRNDTLSELGSQRFTPKFVQPGYGGGKGHPLDSYDRKYLTSEHYLIRGAKTAHHPWAKITYFENDAYIGDVFSRGAYWESGTIDEVASRLSGLDGHVLDIGAHVGSHSIGLAHANPDLTFTCFEPQRPLYLLLERNIAENQMDTRIKSVNAAVAHTASCLTLSASVQIDGQNRDVRLEYGGATLVNLGGAQIGLGGQQCEAVRIDDLVFPPVTYVKVDVEGAEPLAFYGMQQLLKRELPHVLFENRADRRLADAALDKMNVPERVRIFSPREYLEKLGYKIDKLGLDLIGRPPLTAASIARASDPDVSRIPKRIFQTWKVRSPLPANFEAWSDSIRNIHADYYYELWDDTDNRRFISDQFPWFLEKYDAYPKEIYRADAVRYFYLYAFGGFYLDMDVIATKRLDMHLGQGDVLVGRMGPYPEHSQSIPNAIMASRPRRDFWLFLIRELMRRSDPEQGVEWHTGPALLKYCVDRWLALGQGQRDKEVRQIADMLSPEWREHRRTAQLVILPARQWYPIDWTDAIHLHFRLQWVKGHKLSDEEITAYFPESSLVTFWTQSWG